MEKIKAQISKPNKLSIELGLPIDRLKTKLLKEKHIKDEVIDEAIDELAKFFYVIKNDNTNDRVPIGMTSAEVDEVWHTFIIDTKEYFTFCNRYFGFYLHHRPSQPGEDLSASAKKFQKLYKKNFKTKLPSIWKVSGDCDGCLGCCTEGPEPEIKPTLKMELVNI